MKYRQNEKKTQRERERHYQKFKCADNFPIKY